MTTLSFLRDLITNPPVVFGDGDEEHWTRRERWQILRPMWTHTIATIEAPCGCCRRFGLWRTIVCAEHVFGPAWRDQIGDES